MFEMSDSRTSKPYGVRAFKLTIYLAIIVHWFACFYFMICEYEGFGSTGWTYPELKGNENRFIRYSFFQEVVIKQVLPWGGRYSGGISLPITMGYETFLSLCKGVRNKIS